MKAFSSIIIIWLSTVITGAINYLYHPVMLRFLPIATFAEFESLIGIFNVLGVITASLSYFLIKEITTHPDRNSVAKFTFVRGGRWLFWIGLVAYIAYLAGSPLIMQTLHIDQWLPIALVGSMLIISFVGTPASAIAQAFGKFSFLAFNNITSSLLKLGLGCLSVLMGASLISAVFWFLSSSIISTGIVLIYVWNMLKHSPIASGGIEKELWNDFKKEWHNLFQFLLLSGFLAVMMNMDVILAPSFFDKETAGAYAAISVLAKFIMFLIGAIDTVYYPKTTSEKDPVLFRKNMLHAGILIIGSVIGGLIGAWLLGPIFLHVLKPGFEWYASMLLSLIFAFGLYAAMSFYMKILIARKDYRSNVVLFFSSLLFTIPIIFHWGSGLHFYVNLLIASMVFGILGVGGLVFWKKNEA